MLNYESLARKVADGMLLKQKENPGIRIARRKYGKFIDKLLEKKSFSIKGLDKREQRIIKELEKIKYGPLVYRANGTYKVKTRIGEVVRIVYSERDKRCVELSKALRDECWKRGCHVSFIPHSDLDTRKYYQISPEDSLVEMSKISELMAKHIDVRFFVGDDEEPEWSRGLEKRVKLSSSSSQYLHEILDKRKARWCLLGFPVKMDRKSYLVDRKLYEKVYLETIKETFSKNTLNLCNYYKKALSGRNNISIFASDGTALTFSIRGRPLLVADGKIDKEDVKRGDIGLNIPDGEVFTAPLENSANGKILFDHVNISGFGFVKNLWITFNRGKVLDFKSDKKGTAIFRKFLDANTGEKDRIAEFGIGTNMAARFVGATVVDEKIFGSIHIAIGNNTGAYHGKNKASSHQDMIKIMRGRAGRIYADGKLVMSNGFPVKK